MSTLPPNPEAAKFLLGFFADMVDRHGLIPTATTGRFQWTYQRARRRAEVSWDVPAGPISMVFKETSIHVRLLEAKLPVPAYLTNLAENQPLDSTLFEPLQPYRLQRIWTAKPADLRDARGMMMTRNRVLNFFGKARK